jgi:hypothetical protein
MGGSNVGTVYTKGGTSGGIKPHKNKGTMTLAWSTRTGSNNLNSNRSNQTVYSPSSPESNEATESNLPTTFGYKPLREAGASYDTASRERRQLAETYGIQSRKMSDYK